MQTFYKAESAEGARCQHNHRRKKNAQRCLGKFQAHEALGEECGEGVFFRGGVVEPRRVDWSGGRVAASLIPNRQGETVVRLP